MNTRKTKQEFRKKRVRKGVQGTSNRPRLSVFRSNKHIYVQIIDDQKKITLIGASEKQLKDTEKKKKMEIAKELGMHIAKQAKEKKIRKVVFDRGGYTYHGIVKSLALGARQGGLEF